MISIIVSIDDKRGIGKNNDLLVKIPEDLKRLREITTGHSLIMGRKTFESLGRLLPNRTHIVITRDKNSLQHLSYQPDELVNSLEEGIEVARKIEQQRMSLRGTKGYEAIPQQGEDRHASLAMTNPEEEIFVFGGGQIFKEAIEKGLFDRLYLTIIKGDFGA